MRTGVREAVEIGNSAKHIGIVQSLLPPCRLPNIKPYDYFVDVLQRVGQHPPPDASAHATEVVI